MNFKSNKIEDVDVNLTPLIDVVFLLLIFFMITTTFDRYSELRIDLPDATAKSAEQAMKPLDISIDIQGHYYLNGNALVDSSQETLYAAISKAIDGQENKPVVIRADARTPHQSVVTAMDTAARLGITRLSIATSRTETK